MENSPQLEKDNYPLHAGLFVLTIVTTLMAGAILATGVGPEVAIRGGFWAWLGQGTIFSVSFLTFLSFHEFGHYFTALWHRVACSLPYYIPLPPIFGLSLIGSLGAVIRLRQVPGSSLKVFDIGIAGPLAGFVVALLLLGWGFTHLEPVNEVVLPIHPEYVEQFGGVPTEAELRESHPGEGFAVGTCLLFEGMKWLLVSDASQVPPAYELMHYPFLFVGFLGLFFTALNLLPIGQLDGGHVIFGMWGPRRAGMVARVGVMALLFLGGAGLANVWIAGGSWGEWMSGAGVNLLLYAAAWALTLRKIFPRLEQGALAALVLSAVALSAGCCWLWPAMEANLVWLIYTFFAVRFIGVDHPPVAVVEPLDPRRRALGWLAILIFILCFTPNPLYII